MHELALTQSVVDMVAERVGEVRVRRVRLEIGRLSGVAVESVRFCFELVTAATVLSGADLEIVEPPGRARCRRCRTELDVVDFLAECPCGSVDLEVLGGQQVLIREVEVV